MKACFKFLFIILLIWLIRPFKAKAQKVDLGGSWELTFFPQPLPAVTSPDELINIDARKIEATVPGNVGLDLFKAGLIPDLRIGSNVYALRKYEGYQWCYTKRFKSPKFTKSEQVKLSFGGIDCMAEIWLNGKHIGSIEDMFIAHSYIVTSLLVDKGVNTLQIIIRSAVIEAQKYPIGTISFGYYPAPGSAYIRKPPFSYGWDIMPRVITAGIWRDVSLNVINDAHIGNIQWITSDIDLKAREATVLADVQLNIPFEKLDRTYAVISLTRNGKVAYKDKVLVTSSAFQKIIHLKNVDFWWPRGYGRAALYDANVMMVSQSGHVLSEDRCRIGIRTIQLNRSDVNGADSIGHFQFIINGVPVFVKGTNWTPLDAFPSRDDSLVEGVIQGVADLNCNMIRCWGGNIYPGNRFYDLCDENGIMVWQDFAMACTIYPQRTDFQRLIEKEAISIVTKLRNHPSLVLWAGNNEGDISLRWTLQNFNINPNKDVITRKVIPRVLYEFDPTRPYLPSSPYYSKAVYEQGGQDNLLPENHLWGPRGYYKSGYYIHSRAGFVSEIGYFGIPNKSLLEKIFIKDNVSPWINGRINSWNDEWITKSVRRFRSKSGPGIERLNLITKQIKDLFGYVPKDLDSLVIASQIAQAEAIKFFIEKWRSDKPRRSGIIWWNIRDGWPIISDAVMDYYNSKKLAYYFIKNIQRNICILISDNPDGKHLLMAVNDTRDSSMGSVVVTDVTSGKLIYQGRFKVGINEAAQIAVLPTMKGQGMLLIRYEIGKKKYSNHYLYGKPPFKLNEYLKLLRMADVYRVNIRTNMYAIR